MNDKEFEKAIRDFQQQPLQWYSKKSPMEELKDRWCSLIRHNAKLLVDYAHEKGERDKLPSPELFAIASEIEAFFAGLSHNK
jgi:hypothetical protein